MRTHKPRVTAYYILPNGRVHAHAPFGIFCHNVTSIHIEATSTQLSQTCNTHSFFGLPLSVHRCWCH
ncbi:hypothetical protein CLI86_12405 [Tannerella forsythia]|uniref:Uncharacterized protein n=1 Tax=Tannerella forsythia TaxID=28112 RepID=A0A2A6E474_TANFO|nr:hypothetical protein CLI86_12405 [Tannerella forsythia]